MSKDNSVRSLKSSLLAGVSYQAQHNAFVFMQDEREERLRKNIDALEALQREQNEQPPQE